MRTSRLIGTALATIGLASAATVLPVNPAISTAAAATPQSICGSGYYVQRSHALPGAVAYQLYNGSYNCAVTIKTASVGKPTRVGAGLLIKGGSWSYDTGDYRYHAGPVKGRAAGKCVSYWGLSGGVPYTSPFGNCG